MNAGDKESEAIREANERFADRESGMAEGVSPKDAMESARQSQGSGRRAERPQGTQGTQRSVRDPLTGKVIQCAIEVHRTLGPGLLESTYEQCLARELSLQGVAFQVQVPLPVVYKNVRLDCGYRIDVVVESQLILELKAVEEVKGIHQAQLLTYMKLSGIGTGLLININVPILKEGIQRFKI
ncbi:MAG: GxxExxY protein [Pirellulaceae bacterium]